jgi:hypothetical protein
MGFHRRHINDKSLIITAEVQDFEGFKKYMLNADDYNLEGEHCGNIWDIFYQAKEAREHIWSILRSESENRSKMVEAISKSWGVILYHPNKLDGLSNYLDIVRDLGKNEEDGFHLNEIVKIIKSKIAYAKSTIYN